jgi:glycosyltransferase involved in cell wall biosynthesis
MGAFGDDYYWVEACLNKIFNYSFLGLYQNNEAMILSEIGAQNAIYLHNTTSSYKHNKYVANLSDSIIAGTYDYWLPYHKSEFSNKLKFIPFPINTDEILYQPNILKNNKIVFFIGIQKDRYFWKGLDWVCPVLNEFKERYPNDIELCFVEDVPYDEYIKIMNRANIIVDQIYSMGQGMNALTALAKGKIVMTGAEDSQYSLIGELKNRPIINITPDKIQIKNQLELILDSRNTFENWGERCRKYIEDHHNYINIAKQYCQAWGI